MWVYYLLNHYNCQCCKTMHVHMNILFSLPELHDYTHVHPCSIPDYPPPFMNHTTIPMYSHVQYQTTLLPSWITLLPSCTMYSHVQYQTTLLPSWITWLYPCTAMFNTRLPSSLLESHDYTHVYCTAMWEHPTWMESHTSSIMWLYPKHTPKLSHNWTLNELYIHTSVKCRPI